MALKKEQKVGIGLGIAGALGLAYVLAKPSIPEEAKPGQLYGKVTDFETGQAISGIDVELTDITNPAEPLVTSTDSNGNYAFDDLVPGVYQMYFIDPTGYYRMQAGGM